MSKQYGKLPLSFEANQGQVDNRVRYLSRGSGYNLFLTSTEAVLALSRPGIVKTKRGQIAGHQSAKARDVNLQQAVLRMKIVGANPQAEVRGVDEQSSKSNYFIGDDSSKWQTNVAHYARVRYSGIYPGVDLIYYGNQRQLEYDLVVAPGAGAGSIKLAFDGARAMKLDANGALRLSTPCGELLQHKPVIYQEVNGERQEIAGRYVIKGRRKVGFEIAEYDRSRPLVIDPALSYSTYLGGNDNDAGYAITVDASGNAYITGMTNSINFPAVNSLPHGPENAYTFITKLNAAGSALVYSTYVGGMGGSFALEQGNSIAVDSAGNAYVAGSTQSSDFPTVNAYQTSFHGGGRDAYALKLSPTGSALVYSTYLGGSADDEGRGIAVDSIGDAYLIGRTVSTDFPTTNALQPVYGGNTCGPSNPCDDAFITKLAPSGSTLVYSTYLGGERRESGNAIAVDPSGSAYVTGFTNSPNFPTTANALQKEYSGQGTNSEEHDAFITKLNPSGSAFVYSTYLGGSLGSEDGNGIAVDAAGNAYVAGETNARNFPTVNAVQPEIAPGGNGAGSQFSDAFVSKLDETGSALIYSTFLGGSQVDAARSIAIDPAGSAYVTGYTNSYNFPVANAFQPNPGSPVDFTSSSDAFITKLSPSGSTFVYSSFLGGGNLEAGRGIAVDSTGNAYLTGYTLSQNFPTAAPLQSSNAGGNFFGDAFVTKISNSIPPVTLSLSAIQPDRGGNTGFVTVTVHGNGFANGATVKLAGAGQPDIVASSVRLSGSTVATVRFDLSGQAAGVRDVMITNPDGTSVTRAGAFEVEAGGAPQIWVDILGRNEIRSGQPQTYYVDFGNSGNVDAMLVPIFITLPKNVDYELGFSFIPIPQPVAGKNFDFDQIPAHYETATEKLIPLLAAFVPAGRSDYLKIRATVHARQGDPPIQLKVRAGQPIRYSPQIPVVTPIGSMMSSTAEVESEGASFLGCMETIGTRIYSCIKGAEPENAGCVELSKNYMRELLREGVITALDAGTGNFTPSGGMISITKATAGQAVLIAGCEGIDSFPQGEVLVAGVNCGFGFGEISSSCIGFDVFDSIAQKLVHLIWGADPNDKVGSEGAGIRHYLAGREPLDYAIYLENLESATGPAQTVIVTDQLDASKLDLDTFSLGPIFFGVDKKVIPPPGLSEYTMDVDLRPQQSLIAHIEAKLDKITGLLMWRFTSLDPATGQPTDDPLAGFLPPNRNAPEGEAQVLFTVRAKRNIAAGTEIRNRATIVFDTNQPIDTPEWLNTIDNAKPESHVLPLAPTECATTYDVRWTGDDQGSGIHDFTIFVSDNGGPFLSLLSQTTATQMFFHGQPDHTYAFYSIARDNTFNTEDAHPEPDAIITVRPPEPPTITAPRSMTVMSGADATACGAFISDATLGTATVNSSCSGITLRRDGIPANHFFPVGITTIKYTATDEAGNTVAATQLVTVIDNTPPKITGVSVNNPVLGSPNHKMVDVTVNYDATDNCGPVTCQITVSSNEPVNGLGDGDTSPDWEVVDAHHVRLRAERSGKGDGRIYQIKITCADRSRNSSTKTIAVAVPLNRK